MEIIDSIFDSIKTQLPLDPSITDFDTAILSSINSSLFTLWQLGIGPKTGYRISSEKDTYSDYLGEGNPLIAEVDQYLYLNAKIFIDPPSNSSLLETYKQRIKECEWRLANSHLMKVQSELDLMIVRYYVDGSLVYSQKYKEGQNVLNPKYDPPEKSGWFFVGWTNVSEGKKPLSRLVMGNKSIDLYAIYGTKYPIEVEIVPGENS